MDFNQTSQKIHNQILRAKEILIISHNQPDADAFGSMIAMGHWLDALEKKHHKLAYQPLPENLGWLTDYRPVFIDALDEKNKYDLIIVLDSSDLIRSKTNQIISLLETRPLIINIDHHHANDLFGDLNLVLPDASSTTEVIYRLLKSINFSLNRHIANALLAGMLGDTYNFTNANTKEQAMIMASNLLFFGASLNQASDSLLKIKSLDSMIVWGEILKRIKYNSNLGIASALILQEDIKPGVSETEISEGIANFLNSLDGVKALLLLHQQTNGLIKGSLRTNDDLIDVSKLAKILGGGGHKKASGFTLQGQLVQTEQGSWKII